jgi:hypothetical protein
MTNNLRLRITTTAIGIILINASATNSADRGISPGPTTITAEEKAIVPDPAAGTAHAVILVEETERDETVGADMETRFHLRAKILSDEGLDLARLDIPFTPGNSRLRKWWGRTLLPDGSILELKEEDLERPSNAVAEGNKNDALRGLLRGVVPGCVVDYGYTVRESSAVGEGYLEDGIIRYRRILDPAVRVPLQRAWLVREFRYRWKSIRMSDWMLERRWEPISWISHAERLDVHVSQDRGGVLVTGRDLSPFIAEPLMPPDHEVAAKAVFFYNYGGEGTRDYWTLKGKAIEREVRDFARKDGPAREVVASWTLAPGADLISKLRTAHDWILANVRNDTLLPDEEYQGRNDFEQPGLYDAANLLARGHGIDDQINKLFIAFARALGAEAYLVLAADRTFNDFDPGSYSLQHFDASLVEVRTPGDPDGKAIFTDPGAGLPFGEIPWRLAGAKGFLAHGKGWRAVFLPFSAAERNLATVKVDVRPADDRSSVVSSWKLRATGQFGADLKAAARRTDSISRRSWLDGLCGASSAAKVTSAEASGLDGASNEFDLLCSLERSDWMAETSRDRLSLTWTGPWVRDVPELPSGPRTHPVKFDFPRVEVLEMNVATPADFVPTEAPQPVRLEGRHGRYVLVVTPTPSGYRVNREFALHRSEIPAAEYESLRDFLAAARRADRTLLEFQRQRTDESR